ncbi:MAG: hypothetical protein P8Z35_07425 [Ignavibacteriaceae bacterium]
MKKLKINLFISLGLGFISLVILILDFIFFQNVSIGNGNIGFEITFIDYSFFVYLIFIISIFLTIFQTFIFLNKKISKVY